MQTRRQFIIRGGQLVAAATAAATGPTVFSRDAQAASQLKILQWSHFVPAYDAWFDPWAKKWGAAKGIEVTVDHVGFADVVPRATADVAAQSGHDIHMFIGLGSAFEEHVLDLTDVHVMLEKKYGPEIELAKRSTYNPHTKKYFALSDMWVPDPGDYLKSYWTEAGMPEGPVTWEDLVKAAPEIKKRHPEIQIPIGIGLSQDIDSNMAVRDILWCFGGSLQDKDSNVVLNSPETLAALEYAKRLYSVGMTQAVLSWNAASNNQALIAKETTYILNSISAYRTAQDKNEVRWRMTSTSRGPSRAPRASSSRPSTSCRATRCGSSRRTRTPPRSSWSPWSTPPASRRWRASSTTSRRSTARSPSPTFR